MSLHHSKLARSGAHFCQVDNINQTWNFNSLILSQSWKTTVLKNLPVLVYWNHKHLMKYKKKIVNHSIPHQVCQQQHCLHIKILLSLCVQCIKKCTGQVMKQKSADWIIRHHHNLPYWLYQFTGRERVNRLTHSIYGCSD